MVRSQIQFEPAQYEQIRRLAHRERISIAEAVRRLVNRGLSMGGELEASPRAAALLDLAGFASGGPRDLAQRHDEYLDEDLGR